MSRLQKVVVLTMAFLGLVLGGARWSELMAERLDRLNSKDGGQVDEIKKELLKARKKQIDFLCGIVSSIDKQREYEYSVTTAIHLLGEYRAPECVEMLVKLVAYPLVLANGEPGPTADLAGGQYLWWRVHEWTYPAGSALVSIGAPSVPPLWEALRTTENGSRRTGVLAALVEIQGHEQVKKRIEEMLQESREPSVERSLNTALKLLSAKREIEEVGLNRWIELQKKKHHDRAGNKD